MDVKTRKRYVVKNLSQWGTWLVGVVDWHTESIKRDLIGWVCEFIWNCVASMEQSVQLFDLMRFQLRSGYLTMGRWRSGRIEVSTQEINIIVQIVLC